MDELTGLDKGLDLKLDLDGFIKDEKATAKVRGYLKILEDFFGVTLSEDQFPKVYLNPLASTSGYYPPTNTIILCYGHTYADFAEEIMHCFRENVKGGKDQPFPQDKREMVDEFFGRLGDRIIRKLLDIKDVKDRNFSGWISVSYHNLILLLKNIRLRTKDQSLKTSTNNAINQKVNVIQMIQELAKDLNEMLTDSNIMEDRLKLAEGLEKIHQARLTIAQTLFSEFTSSAKFLPIDVMAMDYFIKHNFARLKNLISLVKNPEINPEKVMTWKSTILADYSDSIKRYTQSNNTSLNIQAIDIICGKIQINKDQNHLVGYFVAENLPWEFILLNENMITWSDQGVWEKIFLDPKMASQLKRAGYIIN